MAFYGQVVAPKAVRPFVPGQDADNSILHLSQACLLATVKEGKRASLMARFGGSEEPAVCLTTLTAGRQDSSALDIFLDRYTEFFVLGDDVEVHLSGYFAPPDTMPPGGGESDDDEDYTGQDELEGESDEEDEDGPAKAMAFRQLLGLPGMNGMMGQDSDDGSTGEGEDSEDEGESDEEEGESDEDMEEGGKTPQCVIEEIDEQQQEAEVGNKRAAEEAQQGSSKKQRALEGPQQQQPQEVKVEVKQEKKEQQAKPEQQQQQQQQSKKQEKKQKQQQQQQQQQQPTPEKDSTAAGEVKTNKKNVRSWENGFTIEEVAQGQPNGKLAKAGKRCTLKYVGKLKSNGKVFDQTKGKPFTFRLGIGEVIKGWDLGVQGMRVGDKRRVTIPPQLGYGSSGVKGAIPPNATLEFDMELVDVK